MTTVFLISKFFMDCLRNNVIHVAGICISVVTDFTLTPGMYPIRRNNKRQKDNNSYCNQASFSGAFLLSFHPFLLEIFV